MAFEKIFLIIYSLEMVLKIIGLGFIFGENAYIRDNWNKLDFIVVVTAYFELIFQSENLKFNVLRALRVLRPLRTITSIKELKKIMQALFSALPLIKDTIIIFMFFYIIFAIAGMQLFMGVLLKRCFYIENGIIS